MYLRDTAKYQKEQEVFQKALVEEAVKGITKLDTLPNMAQPLQGEVEAMYFKSLRDFFENSVSHRIMSFGQDVCEGK